MADKMRKVTYTSDNIEHFQFRFTRIEMARIVAKIELAPIVKKKHNRLTPERLLDIMHYINKIPDMQVEGKNLREIISNKIMGKEVVYE